MAGPIPSLRSGALDDKPCELPEVDEVIARLPLEGGDYIIEFGQQRDQDLSALMIEGRAAPV